MSVKISNEDSQALSSVFGDGGRFGQVLVNLVSNALKFTKSKGRVGVEVELTRSEKLTSIEDYKGFEI